MLLFLLLGAIINIAVAWYCALAPRIPFLVDNAPAPIDEVRRLVNMDPCQQFQEHRTEIDETIKGGEDVDKWYSEVAFDPGAMEILISFTLPDYETLLYEMSFGAPLRAMAKYEFAGLLNDGDYVWPSQDKWSIPCPAALGPFTITNADMKRLPLRPMWPGFLFNMIFYATFAWFLFAFPFQFRRWRRARLGLCLKCAYPIGTSDTCTECGRPVCHS